jgi:hypothetical protein
MTEELISTKELKDRFYRRIEWLEKDVHDQYSLGLFHGAEYDAKLVDEIPTIDVVDKIASFIEQEDNWRLLNDCWIVNDRSEDLRALLKRALES